MDKMKIKRKKKKDGYLRIKDLKDIIENMDDDRVVILSSDGEGNNFSPLSSEILIGIYEPYSPDLIYRGEVGIEELTQEFKDIGYDEDDILEGERCLTLFPIN